MCVCLCCSGRRREWGGWRGSVERWDRDLSRFIDDYDYDDDSLSLFVRVPLPLDFSVVSVLLQSISVS